MENEVKWGAIMLIGIAIAISSCESISAIARAQVEIAQIECAEEKEDG